MQLAWIGRECGSLTHTHAKCMDGSRFFTRVCVSVSKILSKLVRVRAEYSKHQQGNAVDETMGE